MASTATYVFGDVHGYLDNLVRVLREAALIDEGWAWTGDDATLWFLGDFTDRGPDGIGVIDLVMRLQKEAPAAGGRVNVVIGNHEILLLAAYRYGRRITFDSGKSFVDYWEMNGGQGRDIARLRPEHVAWIDRLPALAVADGRLFAHADATMYLRYGRTVGQVNRALRLVLAGDDARAWLFLLDVFTERRAFVDERPDGRERAAAFLGAFGAHQLIHGHTPIPYMCGLPPETVTAAFVYAGGLCVNTDSGMPVGGPGFIYRVPDEDATAASGSPDHPA